MAAPMITGSVGGYSAEFLSPKEQERFTFVKTKICGNKAVDVQNLEKSGMTSLVEALRRMQWMDVATFTEVSYLDLVKAFFICLKPEADGSLVSSVRGIQIKINHELLHELFGVKTSGYSGIHSMNDEVKGLGIIGPGFKLKDGKLDINQMSAFNRLLHFIVCQIIVPRSATFSSCTRADSDIMFWAIQNKEINLAAVMIERMKFAHAQIWETKSKLNVYLPYAHLLTKIFKHFGVDVSGVVVEKMGQSIRSRNLKKSEGEAIIGDIPEVQKEAAAAEQAAVAEQATAAEQAAAAELAAAVVQAAAVPVVASQAEVSESPVVEIDSHSPEVQMEDGAAGVADSLPTTLVASILREVLDSIPSTSATSKVGGCVEEEVMAPGHTEIQSEPVANVEIQAGTQQDVVMEEAPSQGEQSVIEPEMSESVAEGHLEKVVLEDAPTQGEQESVELPAPIQGEQVGTEEPLVENVPESAAPSQEIPPPASVPVSEGPSASNINHVEPVTQQGKQKRIVFRRPRKGHRKVNLKPVMALLKAQGEILSSVQTSIQGIVASQASTSSDLSSIRNAMKWFNKEMSDMKSMLAVLSKYSRVSPSRPAAAPRPPGPAGPSAQVSRPAGPSVLGSEEPVLASGSSGPSSAVSEGQAKGKEPLTASKAPDTSSLATPTLSSPPSPSTAPPAPPTIKHPVPRTQPSSSFISSQPSFSPTPSHISAPSSFNPKPSPPQAQTPPVQPTSSFNPKHLFYPPTPPSSVIFPPEKPLPLGVFDTNLPDDFERNTLITILSTASHIHRTDPPSPAKKKRKTSSSLGIPSVPLFPPLWYSLTLDPKRRPIYKEYLQKCILSTIYGIPFLNLSEHLNIVLPLTQISQFLKSKILEGTEFKTEDQWAAVKGNKAQYEKYLTARAESPTHRAHPLTFSEWFIIQNKNSWGPYILKEIRIARNFQLYSDFCYLNKLPETMVTRGRRGAGPARGDVSAGDQQAPAQQAQDQTGVPLPPPPPPVDYGALMQGLVHAMQTQAHTTAALQAQVQVQA
ncbi:hypothetical protein Taro_028796 [Colocasia esculenta]|uniref:Putative plant transposon protein domain-containing protein n=1 Tax=Colocasia esculenta TaxID=4460 RepID=A0A843VYB6_COLES|nr:hypothetical protein [Colocasia esculenta]